MTDPGPDRPGAGSDRPGAGSDRPGAGAASPGDHHRPVEAGSPGRNPRSPEEVVLRPRTIAPLGAPVAVHPLESMVDPSWQPALDTGSTIAVTTSNVDRAENTVENAIDHTMAVDLSDADRREAQVGRDARRRAPTPARDHAPTRARLRAGDSGADSNRIGPDQDQATPTTSEDDAGDPAPGDRAHARARDRDRAPDLDRPPQGGAEVGDASLLTAFDTDEIWVVPGLSPIPEAALDNPSGYESEPSSPTAPGDGGAAPTDQAGATVGKGMLRSNLAVASGTAVSRLSGLVRTSLILVLLGQGLNDAFVNANNTPNMIYELILGGILTATLVPLFTDDLEHGGKDDATSAIISFALVALVIVTALAAVAAPLLILLLSTGSAEASRADYVSAGIPLALLFAPQVFFYGLMAVWSAVLNARHRFLAAAWAPVLNNVIAIATLLVAGSMAGGSPTLDDALSDTRILWVLGVGTTAGIVVMALSLYPVVRRTGFRLNFKLDLKHRAVRQAVRLSGWTFGYVMANQVAVIVIQILAKPSSGDPTRYQTAFQYFQLPHGLLAVSIMVTFEPVLGRADARGDRAGFNEHLLLGFRLIGLLIIPAAVGYVALPKGLDHIDFVAAGELGKVLGLGGIIAAFAIGLPGFSTYLYALRAFYAMKNTKIPFMVNVLENALNIVFALILVRIWGVVGLALAFALAYSVAAVVAVAMLQRHSPGFDWQALVTTWLRLLTAAGVMGGLVYAVVTISSPDSAMMLVPVTAGAIALGAVTYFAAILVLRVPGITELFARLPGLRRFAPRV